MFRDGQVKYIYREVEIDAVLDAVSDSEPGLKFGLYGGILVNASYFTTEAITGQKDDLSRL